MLFNDGSRDERASHRAHCNKSNLILWLCQSLRAIEIFQARATVMMPALFPFDLKRWHSYNASHIQKSLSFCVVSTVFSLFPLFFVSTVPRLFYTYYIYIATWVETIACTSSGRADSIGPKKWTSRPRPIRCAVYGRCMSGYSCWLA